MEILSRNQNCFHKSVNKMSILNRAIFKHKQMSLY